MGEAGATNEQRREYMSGVKHPDLAGLPEEIADLVQKALAG